MAHSHARWVLALLFLAILVLPQAVGIAPRVGVKAGDWAHYVVTQQVSGSASLLRSFIDQYSPYAETSYLSLNVTQIVKGSNVSMILEIHHTNTSIARSYQMVNVSLDITPDNPPIVIASNMTAPTYTSEGNFSYVHRIINNLEVSSPPGSNSSALRYSWDKYTGILLSEQFVYNRANATSSGTFTFTLAITGTNLWHYVPPKPTPNPPPAKPPGIQFTELYVLAGVLGSVTLGLAAYALKRSPRTKGRPRTGARDSRNASRALSQKKHTKH